MDKIQEKELLKNWRINGRCPKCKIPIIDTGCFMHKELEKMREEKKVNYLCGLRHGRDLFNCVKCGTLITHKTFEEYVEPPKCECGTPFWIERFGGSDHLEQLNKKKEFTYHETDEPWYIESDKIKGLPRTIMCVKCGKKINTKNREEMFKFPEQMIRKSAGNCSKCQLSIYFTEHNINDNYLKEKAKKKQINYVVYYNTKEPKQIACVKCNTSFLFKPKPGFFN